MPVLLNIVNILTWFVSRQAIRQLHGLVILLKIDMTFEVFDDDEKQQQQKKKKTVKSTKRLVGREAKAVVIESLKKNV